MERQCLSPLECMRSDVGDDGVVFARIFIPAVSRYAVNVAGASGPFLIYSQLLSIHLLEQYP